MIELPRPPRPIKEYKTVSTDFPEDFDNLVLKKLKQGYTFHDNLQVIPNSLSGGLRYVRTMVKESF